MSCATLTQGSTTGFNVSMASLPEGFCPANMQELANAIAARLLVSSNQAFSSFAIGSVEPSSNVGPWLKDCLTWFVFDDATSRYIPMTKGGFDGEQYFSSSGTFIVPADIYKIKAHVWGAGGGGWNGDGGAISGGGGGGGGYARQIFSVTPGQAITVTVGTGGAGGAPGGTGGNTTILTLVGNGGVGGPVIVNDSGAGGTTSGGFFSINGGSGDVGNGGQAGSGGNAGQGGQGGIFSLVTSARRTGVAPGGGGSGGYQIYLAGSGANGGVLIQF